MFGVKRSPPRSLLENAVNTLEAAGLTCALGGSGLLAALGLADSIRDWDLTTDADLERVAPLFAGAPSLASGPSGVHADHKLALEDGAIEIICRFAFRSGEAVVRIPTVVSARREGIPIGSAEAWAIAYALLGRPAKSELLFAWLRERGADSAVIKRLLAEPLPGALARALDALPRRPPSSTA